MMEGLDMPTLENARTERLVPWVRGVLITVLIAGIALVFSMVAAPERTYAVDSTIWWGIADGTLYLSASDGENHRNSCSATTRSWTEDEYKDTFTQVVIDGPLAPATLRGWFNQCKQLATVNNFENIDTTSVTSFAYLFTGCSSLTAFSLPSSWNCSNVTDMYAMFSSCSSLSQVTLPSNLDTSSVRDMRSMFWECRSLRSLDLTPFDTQSTTAMGCMFYYCTGLETLDISSFDTSCVTNMYAMFTNCRSLRQLDVSHFDVTNCQVLPTFSDCYALEHISLFPVNNATVHYVGYMFSRCRKLTEIDVAGFNTSSLLGYEGMFRECVSVRRLDLRGFDTRSVVVSDYSPGWGDRPRLSMANMFQGMTNLSAIYLPATFSFDGDNIEDVSLQALLPTPPSSTTTGMWVKSDYSAGPFTAEYLRDNWDAHASEWAGEWVWDTYERNGSANANDGTGSMSMRMIAMDRWEHTGTDEVASTIPDSSVPSSYTGNLDGDHNGYGDNLAFSVPASINYVVKADGTLLGPSNIRISNMSAYPIRMSSLRITAITPFSIVEDARMSAATNSVSLDVGVAQDMLHAFQYASKAAPSDATKWNMGSYGLATGDLAISSSGQASHLTVDVTSRTNFASIRWYLTPGAAS